jgi:hypothetical protein
MGHVAINRAISVLALGDQVRELSSVEAENLLQQIQINFLTRSNALFWWEHLSGEFERYTPPDDNAYQFVATLTPTPNECALFIADLTGSAQTVYECVPEVVPLILGECPAFEYAVVAKDFTWLVIENHHGCLFAIGEVPMRRLRELRHS